MLSGIVAYTRRIVCLAKSTKLGATCVAGREWDGANPGAWIRPVGHRPSEAIEDHEMEYVGGGTLELLDVVDIQFLGPKPHACQVENYLIDGGAGWRKIGTLDRERIPALAEEPLDLWGTEKHGYIRDRIPIAQADQLRSSLLLVALDQPAVEVQNFPERTTVRLDFRYRGVPYNMSITDPDFKERFVTRNPGRYALGDNTYACLSLGEPSGGMRYKLAAAVFELD